MFFTARHTSLVLRKKIYRPTLNTFFRTLCSTNTEVGVDDDNEFLRENLLKESAKPLPTQAAVRPSDDEALESVLLENTVAAREKFGLNPSPRDPTGMYTPHQLQLMVESTQELYENGDYYGAAKILREVLRHDPSHSHASILIVQMNLACIPGLMHVDAGEERKWTKKRKEKNAEAIGLMREAQRFAPKDPEVLKALGLALSRSAVSISGHDEAISYLRRSVTLGDEQEGTRSAELALLAALQKKSEDAAAEWMSLSASASEEEDTEEKRRRRDELLQHADSAMEECIDIAQDMSPADLHATQKKTSFSLASAQLTRAELLRQRGDLNGAVQCVREAWQDMKAAEERSWVDAEEKADLDARLELESDEREMQIRDSGSIENALGVREIRQRALATQLYSETGMQLLLKAIGGVDNLGNLDAVADAVTVLEECKTAVQETISAARKANDSEVLEQMKDIPKVLENAGEPLFLQGLALVGSPKDVAIRAQGGAQTNSSMNNGTNPIAATTLLKMASSLRGESVESHVALGQALVSSASYFEGNNAMETEAAAIAQFREAWKLLDADSGLMSVSKSTEEDKLSPEMPQMSQIRAAAGWNDNSKRTLLASGKLTMGTVIARHALDRAANLDAAEKKIQLLEAVRHLRDAIRIESRSAVPVQERCLTHWQVLLDAAQFAFEAQDIDQAKTLIQGGLSSAEEENAPPSGLTHLHCMLGHSLRKTGAPVQEVIESYQNALHVTGGSLGKLGLAEVPARLGLGTMLHRVGKATEGAREFRAILAQAEDAVEGNNGDLMQGSGVPITSQQVRQARVGFGLAVMDSEQDAEAILRSMERSEKGDDKDNYVESDTLTLAVAEQQLELAMMDAMNTQEMLDQSVLQAHISLGFLAAARKNVEKSRMRFLGAAEVARGLGGPLEPVTSMQAHLGLQLVYSEAGLDEEAKVQGELAVDARKRMLDQQEQSSGIVTKDSMNADLEKLDAVIGFLRKRLMQEEGGKVLEEPKDMFPFGQFKQFH
eukprot:g1365.t1